MRVHSRRRFLKTSGGLLFSSLGISACGNKSGMSPTGPTPPPPTTSTTLQIVTGANLPVVGAAIKVTEGANTVSVVSDGSGTTTFSGQFSSAAEVLVSANGFCDLHAHIRDGNWLSMWPADSRLPPDVTYGMIFHNTSVGDVRLYHPMINIAIEVSDPLISDNPTSMAAIQNAIGKLNATLALVPAQGSKVNVSLVGAAPAGTGRVYMLIDPDISSAALTDVTSTGTRIRFKDPKTVTYIGALLHEFGRVIGLDGFNPQSGVMSADSVVYSYTDYTQVEKNAIVAAFSTPVGSQFSLNPLAIMRP